MTDDRKTRNLAPSRGLNASRTPSSILRCTVERETPNIRAAVPVVTVSGNLGNI